MTYLKSLIVTKFSNLLLMAQKGYPLDEYGEIKLAMETVNLIQDYDDPTSVYYVQPYKVETLLDYHIHELNKL